MSAVFWVALGGAAGSAARFGLNNWVGRYLDGAFPWGIFIVNVAGCFTMGLVAALMLKVGALADPVRHLVAIGFLGGFTTFSAFALDAVRLVQSGHQGLAVAYVIGSVVLCLLATFAGLALMRAALSL